MSDSFVIDQARIDTRSCASALLNRRCGALATFEGWVRDHHEGRAVEKLEYEAFAALARNEGERIISEAMNRFAIEQARCVHRVGALAIGEIAVWVGVTAVHRDAAFEACRYVIDEVKHRVPIWKKEYYADGSAEWVNCAGCATSGANAMARQPSR